MQFDYIVIGGGSGGIASARRAAQYGAKVALIEKGPLGGTCVNVGCVPKKVMWNAASIAEAQHLAADYGFSYSTPTGKKSLDWQYLFRQRNEYVSRLNSIYATNLEKSKITFFAGLARFSGRGEVTVDEQVLSSKNILIATGGKPLIPNLPGSELGSTSDDFFRWNERPESVAVIGAGYIAVELAGVLNTLGTEVTLYLRGDRPLRSFDQDIGYLLKEEMLAQGMKVVTESDIKQLLPVESMIKVVANKPENTRTVSKVLFAVGRVPAIKELCLEAIGLEQHSSGHIEVDEFQNTSVAGVYAVGDVIGKIDLTPVAIAAGRQLAERLFNGKTEARLDYSKIATVTFSHPPIGTVGYSEAAAIKEYGANNIKIYKSQFKNMYFSPTRSSEQTLVKIVCFGESEKIIGLHVIGRGADEMMQGFAVAIKMGACKSDFDETVAIHPTAAEEFVTFT